MRMAWLQSVVVSGAMSCPSKVRRIRSLNCDTPRKTFSGVFPGVSLSGVLVQQQGWFLQDRSDIGHEAGREVPVHHAVVEGAAQGGDPTRDHFPVHNPWLLADGAEGNDRDLARVDDRGAGIDAQGTDVGDAQRTIAHVLGTGLAGAS